MQNIIRVKNKSIPLPAGENSSNGDNKRFLKTEKETEIAYDFGKIRTVNGYVRGEKLVNSIPFYVYLINYRQMAGGEKS